MQDLHYLRDYRAGDRNTYFCRIGIRSGSDSYEVRFALDEEVAATRSPIDVALTYKRPEKPGPLPPSSLNLQLRCRDVVAIIGGKAVKQTGEGPWTALAVQLLDPAVLKKGLGHANGVQYGDSPLGDFQSARTAIAVSSILGSGPVASIPPRSAGRIGGLPQLVEVSDMIGTRYDALVMYQGLVGPGGQPHHVAVTADVGLRYDEPEYRLDLELMRVPQ